jgi:uncharacterized protein YbjT (DUF2867 family)
MRLDCHYSSCALTICVHAALPRPSPALQLNPGGVLNYKYAGEGAVRASGLSYCVLRPTGLTNESEPGDFLLEASQGREASMEGTRDGLWGMGMGAH